MPAAEDFRLAVVLPVFNTERDLPECLASISAQTHGRFVVFSRPPRRPIPDSGS